MGTRIQRQADGTVYMDVLWLRDVMRSVSGMEDGSCMRAVSCMKAGSGMGNGSDKRGRNDMRAEVV